MAKNNAKKNVIDMLGNLTILRGCKMHWEAMKKNWN